MSLCSCRKTLRDSPQAGRLPAAALRQGGGGGLIADPILAWESAGSLLLLSRLWTKPVLPVSQRPGNLGDLSHRVCYFIFLNPPNPQSSPCVCGCARKRCWKQTRCRMKRLGRTLSSREHNGFVRVVQRLIVLPGGSLARQGGEREKGTVPRKKKITGVLFLFLLRSPRWNLFSTCRHGRGCKLARKACCWVGFFFFFEH